MIQPQLCIFFSIYILFFSAPASHKEGTKTNRWSPLTLLPIIIAECALDIVTLTHRTGCRLEITRGGPLSCSHLSPAAPQPNHVLSCSLRARAL